MKIRLKYDGFPPKETTIEDILSGWIPLDGRDGPKPIGYDLFAATAKDGTDIFVGDRVLVRGTKRVGEYETDVIIRHNQPCLDVNKTYLIDSYATSAILQKL